MMKYNNQTKNKTQQVFKTKAYDIKAEDVDVEKGIVTVAVNGIGVEDSQHDISMPGSFTKTLKENMKRMKWLYNHDVHCDIGVPISGEEKNNNLFMTGQLYDTQLSREILNKYKVNAELGKTLEHSIGVQAIKRDEVDKRKVLEWKMFEYSTLSFLGANPNTYLVNLKEATPAQVKDAIEYIGALLKENGFRDETLKNYDMNMQLLLKALNGGNVVTCPYCGKQFDYDEQEQYSFTQQVLDAANMYLYWIADDAVREQMNALAPEIQAQVSEILDAVKSSGAGLSEKAITDLAEYVRCPHCWGKVYKNDKLMQVSSTSEPVEPSDDTQLEKGEASSEEKEAAVDSTSFWNGVIETINNKHF